MQDYNFINIQAFMVNKLHLSGNGLLAYAIIYGFSQDGQSLYKGGISYLQEWLGCSKPTVISILKSLVDKRLIERIESVEKTGWVVYYKIKEGGKEFLTPEFKNFNGGGFKNLNEDINNNIIKENPLKESFDKFWKVYPKQRAGSKEKAFKAFCRAIKEKRATEEILLEGCQKYAQSEEVKKGFAKGGAAWINDDRFNVEYEPANNRFEW